MIELLDNTPEGAILKDQPVEFDVRTDNPNVFLSILVTIEFPGTKITEVAYAQNPTASSAFKPFYGADSSIVEIVDAGYSRFRFSVMRRATTGQDVWPDSPKVRVWAFNDAGEAL